MTTPAEYAAATTAILDLVQADIKSVIPVIFQSEIPAEQVKTFAAVAAKAALDAAAGVRAQQS